MGKRYGQDASCPYLFPMVILDEDFPMVILDGDFPMVIRDGEFSLGDPGWRAGRIDDRCHYFKA